MANLSYIVGTVSVAALVLLPPALMIMRWAWPHRMSTWGILGILLFGGWVLTNVQLHARFAYLGQIVESMPDPDPDDPVVQEWMADGPKMVFALIFGWVVGPLLWLLWSPIFGIVFLGKWLVTRRGDAT